MPEQLLGRIIRACSNPDELVMDPFTGSGTTLAVAKKLGRQHLGFELSEEYAAQASERLEGISNGDPLTGAENPLTSAPSTKDGVILGADGKRRLTTSSKKIRKAEKAAKPHVITVAHRATTHSKGRPSADKELEALIIKAFGKAHDGYSTDAVIANPELNEQFIDQCIRLGTLESPEFLNRRLMRLRKRGNFPIRASRTVRLDVEGFIYAGEITAALLAADHWSLDDVLCSPELAKKFDATAESLSPGFSAFEYRWSALHVRKAYSKRMTLAGNHGAVGRVPRFGKPRPIADRLHEKISAEPGLYVVTSNDGSNLFVGESRNLQKRIASQFNEETIQHWDSLRDARYVRIAAKIHSNNTRVAKHSFLISQWNPILNFRPEQAMATAL
jgi:site-specific DNA-methyltransferase (adenine-specific)